MSQTINSGIYKQGLKWDLLTKNKIDTVTCKPIKNTASESTTIATNTVTSVRIQGVGYTLPIGSGAYQRSSTSIMYNPSSSAYSFGKVLVVQAVGTTTFNLDKPITGSVSASVEFSGTTYHINRASKTHSWYNSIYSESDPTLSIVLSASGSETWSGSKSTDSTNRGQYTDPYLVDYTQSTVPLYPYVRKITEATSAESLTPEQDILTNWIPVPSTAGTMINLYATKTNWNTYGRSGAISMWPSEFVATSESHETQQIVMLNKTIVNSTTVTKLDDYTYSVTFSFPARYTYLASSMADSEIDNYAFVDKISSAKVSLIASEYDETTTDISYSLSGTELTTNAKNTYPISFEQNELITLGTTTTTDAGTGLWTTVVPKDILTKYANGKYIVKCTVPATWAITNSIHVGSEIIVRLLDGTYITRNNSNVVFRVKNIEKVFSGSKFEYNLSLKEK